MQLSCVSASGGHDSGRVRHMWAVTGCKPSLFSLPLGRGSPGPSPALTIGTMSGDTGQPRLIDESRFEAACRGIDAANSLDPNLEIVEGIARPRELVYAERLTHWLLKLCPGASEELRLAARCQHVCRWMIARGSYPMTRPGYLKWREDLKQFHAEKAGDILGAVGYPAESIAKVQALNLKKHFPHDPDSRVLEDALCLVFLEFQFAELSAKTTDEKMINALQKSWKKMTPAAREQAMKLHFGPKQKSLLERALAGRET